MFIEDAHFFSSKGRTLRWGGGNPPDHFESKNLFPMIEKKIDQDQRQGRGD